MTKIGLLGGSFNPAHQGHIYISNLAVKKLGLNQVWWIPTLHNPFKEKSDYLSLEKRIFDCEQLTKNYPKIRVKKFDDIYTFQLVKKLQNKHKNYKFFWIMGADNFEKLDRWHNFKKLLKSITFVVFSRAFFLQKINKTKSFKIYQKLANKQSSLPKILPKILIFRSKNLDISSTSIRKSF